MRHRSFVLTSATICTSLAVVLASAVAAPASSTPSPSQSSKAPFQPATPPQLSHPTLIPGESGPTNKPSPQEQYRMSQAAAARPSQSSARFAKQIVSYPGLSTGDGNWTWEHPTSEGNDINAAACSDATHCFAASTWGNFGGVLRTSDFGGTWSFQASDNFVDATCVNTTTCYAIGYGGFGKTTTATSTQTWTTIPSLGGGYALSCTSTASCWVVYNNAYIANTTDGGVTWTGRYVGYPSLVDIFCISGTNCWAVGYSGRIIHTSDGTTWSAQTSGTTNVLARVACVSTTSCWVTGWNGTILHTADGTTWAAQTSGTTQNFNGVACPGATTCYASGDGVIDKTTDGTTWTLTTGQPTLYRVGCANTSTCLFVGPYGVIIGTTDGGTTLTRKYSQATASPGLNLHTITCDGAADCYTVGDSGTILHTADGTTWSSQTSGTAQPLYGVSCPSFHVCQAVGGNGTILRTADGTTWSPQTSGTTDLLLSVSCPDSAHCFASDDFSGKVFKTTNSGTTWAPITVPSANWFNPIACPTVNICYAAGGGPTSYAVFRTYDGGTTWAFSPSDYFGTLTCPGPYNCYGAGYQLNHTTDGGVSWFNAGGAGLYWYGGLACTNVTTCLFSEAFYTPTMYLTVDSGSHTAVQSDLGAQRTIHSIAVGDSSHVYAVGDNGEILFSSNAFTPPACKTSWMGTDHVTPLPYGSTITFYANSWGCSPEPLYEFWVYPTGGPWINVQAYSDKSTWTWDAGTAASFPALGSKGSYVVLVHIKAKGSSSPYDTFGATSVSFTGCDFASASPNPIMVATAGPAQNINVAAQGSGCIDPRYKVYMFNGTSYIPLQDWTPGSATDSTLTYGIPTTGLSNGNYSMVVHAAAGATNPAVNGLETWGLSTMVIGTPPCNYIPSVSAAEGNPVDDGSTVHFTASVGPAPCTAPLYKFWAFGPQNKWLVLQDWGASPNLALNTATYAWTDNSNVMHTGLQPGTYSIVVHIKQPTSTNIYDTYAMVSESLHGCFAGWGYVSQNPVPVSKQIGVFAGATCDNPQFRFSVMLPGATTWTLIQDWTSTSYIYYDTNGATPGLYIFKVDIKVSGSIQAYDTFMMATSTIVSG